MHNNAQLPATYPAADIASQQQNHRGGLQTAAALLQWVVCMAHGRCCYPHATTCLSTVLLQLPAVGMPHAGMHTTVVTQLNVCGGWQRKASKPLPPNAAAAPAAPKWQMQCSGPPTLLTTLPACTADTWRRHASKSEHPLRAAAATTAAAAAGDQPRPASRHFKQADDSCTGGCSCCRHRCCCRPHRRRKERGLCVRVNTDTHSPPPCAQYLSLWAFTMAATSGTP